MTSLSPRRLTLNFILLSGGEALSKVFAFLAFAYLARILGPDIYGDIEFALAVTLFFSLIGEGGLTLIGAREIAKDEKSVSTLTFHITIMRYLLTFGAFLFLLFFVALSNKSFQEKTLVTLFGLTLFGLAGILRWVFQGLDWMKWVAASSVLRWSLFAAGAFLLIRDPKMVWMVALIELGAISLVVAFNFGIFRYFFGRFWRRFDISYGLSLFRQALPVCLTQIMWGLKIYLPTVMVGLLIGDKAVGWFGASYRIVIALHTFVWMYHFNLYPSISRCTHQKTEYLQKLIGKSLQVTSWVSVFIGIFVIFTARTLINLVYGAQYSESVFCFQVLIWLISLCLISDHYMYILIAYNRQWFELFSSTCGAVANIFLNILLIKWYGFIGAAWALLGTEVLILSLNYYFVNRKVAIVHLWPHVIRPLIVGGIMAAVIMIMPLFNFWITGSTVILLYAIGILVLQPNLISDVRTLIIGSK